MSATPESEREFGVVLLGASEFPNYPPDGGYNNESFARSARAMERLFGPEGTLAHRSYLLNLFDQPGQPNDLILKIDNFINERRSLTDLLIYYCGHGHVLDDRHQSLVLLLRDTRQGKEAGFALRLDALSSMVGTAIGSRRLYALLDCCFSARAVDQLQGPVDEVVSASVDESFAPGGTAVMTASLRDKVARAIEGEPYTMFSGSLIGLLDQGLGPDEEFLSFEQIHRPLTKAIKAKYAGRAVIPALHAPAGDIATLPMFRNKAFNPISKRPATTTEEETIAAALRHLDDPTASVNVRSGAMADLTDLARQTPSNVVKARIESILERVLATSALQDKARDHLQELRGASERRAPGTASKPDGKQAAPSIEPDRARFENIAQDLKAVASATRRSAVDGLTALYSSTAILPLKAEILSLLRGLDQTERGPDVRAALAKFLALAQPKKPNSPNRKTLLRNALIAIAAFLVLLALNTFLSSRNIY